MNNQKDTLFDLNPYQTRSIDKNSVGDWATDINNGLPQARIKRHQTLTPEHLGEIAVSWAPEQLRDAIAQLTKLLPPSPSSTPLADAINQGQHFMEPSSVLEDWHLGYCATFTRTGDTVRMTIAPERLQLSTFVPADQTLEQLHHAFCYAVESTIEQKARQCENILVEKIASVTEEEGVTEATSKVLEVARTSSINIYTPKGRAHTKQQYYRLTYRDKGKLRHKHIPGGNINSLDAQNRRDEIESMLKTGLGMREIVEAIDRWQRL